MTKRIIISSWEILLQLILAFIGILAIGSLPVLFQGLSLNIPAYLTSLYQVGEKIILHASTLQYGTKVKKDLFPQIFFHFKETMIVFLWSFIVSLLVSFIMVHIILRGNSKVQNRIKEFMLFLESLPDILFVLGSQLLVVWVFQKTGFMAAQIAGVGGKTVRLLPIICFCIPTVIMFVKLLILRFEDELNKDYVLYARAKGMDRLHILNHHVLRNVLLSTLFFAKANLWFMLSNLYIIEYFFNTLGFFVFLRSYQSVEVFTIGLMLIYIPIFFIFKCFHWVVPNAMKEKM
ncbi:ABC transporter permease subunit [Bacillus pseudomycoides]|jgi:peptide/nickel transport system permease protein|uniref:ABC transporter permease subunit n=1 Tax=Bacillus pseudomycoides TaxID=64104 RepID=UPI000BEBDC2A|nr:ABC transporter permease subunit [Bacillus pseudomycoides]PEE05000.1 peptide ABC transporter permease [Bacillus pseudomycoides]PEM78526.1 peptide ABC transporter permease [Bacillus pseudomycoides]PHC85247.1 peptide ABC transporter permease [Bacillus pseudomycoides]